MLQFRFKPEAVWSVVCGMGTSNFTLPVAVDDETGDKIVVTTMTDDGCPTIAAIADGEMIYEASAADADDCEDAISDAKTELEWFRRDDVPAVEDDAGAGVEYVEEFCEAQESDEDVREDELLTAMENFYEIATLEAAPNASVIEDCLDHLLEYMHLKHGASIYRPMTVEFPNGEEVYMEYPYPSLEFSDSYSMVYKKN